MAQTLILRRWRKYQIVGTLRLCRLSAVARLKRRAAGGSQYHGGIWQLMASAASARHGGGNRINIYIKLAVASTRCVVAASRMARAGISAWQWRNDGIAIMA